MYTKTNTNNQDKQKILKGFLGIDAKTIDDEKRQIEFTVTKRVVDRDGDLLEPLGMDTKDFEKNPVVMTHHNIHGGLPVGRVVNINKMKSEVRMTVEFATKEDYEYADQIYRLVKGKFLNAVSIGFLYDYRDIERPKDMKVSGKKVERLYKKYSIYELSIVPVPANQDALRKQMQKALKAGKITGDDALYMDKFINSNEQDKTVDLENEITSLKDEKAQLQDDIKDMKNEIEILQAEKELLNSEQSEPSFYEKILTVHRSDKGHTDANQEKTFKLEDLVKDKPKLNLEDLLD